MSTNNQYLARTIVETLQFYAEPGYYDEQAPKTPGRAVIDRGAKARRALSLMSQRVVQEVTETQKRRTANLPPMREATCPESSRPSSET